MKKIHLTYEVAQREPNVLKLFRDLQELQAPMPYEITVKRGRRRFVLSTTSKETHLAFGKLQATGQATLCDLLEAGFEEGNDSEMALSFDQKADQPRQRTQFIVRSEGRDSFGKYTKFHFAPGH